METEEMIQEIKRILQKHFSEETEIWLFGSQASGTSLPTSDIDIGLLGKEKIDPLFMIKIKEELEEIPSLRSIDLVDLHLINETFKQQVLKNGKRL